MGSFAKRVRNDELEVKDFFLIEGRGRYRASHIWHDGSPYYAEGLVDTLENRLMFLAGDECIEDSLQLLEMSAALLNETFVPRSPASSSQRYVIHFLETFDGPTLFVRDLSPPGERMNGWMMSAALPDDRQSQITIIEAGLTIADGLSRMAYDYRDPRARVPVSPKPIAG